MEVVLHSQLKLIIVFSHLYIVVNYPFIYVSHLFIDLVELHGIYIVKLYVQDGFKNRMDLLNLQVVDDGEGSNSCNFGVVYVS